MRGLKKTSLLITTLTLIGLLSFNLWSASAEAALPQACYQFYQKVLSSILPYHKLVTREFRSYFLESEIFSKMHPRDAINAIRSMDHYTVFHFPETYSKKYPEVQEHLNSYRARLDQIPSPKNREEAYQEIKKQLDQWVNQEGWTSYKILENYIKQLDEFEKIGVKISGDEISRLIQSGEIFDLRLKIPPKASEKSRELLDRWNYNRNSFTQIKPNEKKRIKLQAQAFLYRILEILDRHR